MLIFVTFSYLIGHKNVTTKSQLSSEQHIHQFMYINTISYEGNKQNYVQLILLLIVVIICFLVADTYGLFPKVFNWTLDFCKTIRLIFNMCGVKYVVGWVSSPKSCPPPLIHKFLPSVSCYSNYT